MKRTRVAAFLLIGMFLASLSISGRDHPADLKVLLVDDFTTPPMEWQKWWKSNLEKQPGIKPAYHVRDDINRPGKPGPTRLEDFSLVIWHTGLDEENTLTQPDRAALSAHLEGGGNLFLMGTGIPRELIETGHRRWLKRYLRCDFLMPNSPIIEGSVFEHESLVGCEKTLFEGLEFAIDHGDLGSYAVDSPNLVYEDFDPTAGGGGAVHCVRFKNIPGNLGIQFEGPILPGCPPCRIVFLSVPLETIFPEKTRNEMMERILAFFSAPPKEFVEIRGKLRSSVKTDKNVPLEGVLVSLKKASFRTLSKKDGSYILTSIPEPSGLQQYFKQLELFGWKQTSFPELLVMDQRMPPGKLLSQVDTMERISPPLSEGRGIWIIRDQLRSPEAVQKIVKRCERGGFNTLFVQVRGRGDAFYKSATEPRAEILEDQPEDFDPLAMFIELGHEKGMQVHAWMNAFYTYEGATKPYSPKHILARHPEWALTNRSGKSLMEYTKKDLEEQHAEGVYLSPCIPAAREYLTGVYLEVVENYNVDGVHFDFIRFPFSPNRMKNERDLGYSKLSREAFKKEHGMDPLEIDPGNAKMVKTWNDWRRLCVGRLVRDVHKRAHEIKPGIRVSAAVLERYHLARGCHCHQDWIMWMKNGWIDTCCIMAYGSDNELVGKRIRLAVENSGNATVWAGLGAGWRSRRSRGKPESIPERIDIVRREKPEGIMFFAYKHFTDEKLDELKKGPFAIPATVPEVRK